MTDQKVSQDVRQGLLDNILQELRRGTLVMVVLMNLKNQEYGYSLINKLQALGISIEQNTLYPLLRRLEKQGLLVSLWDTSESRPRKYYVISDLGRSILESVIKEWQHNNQIISKMI
ncbi:MAG: PadR family transcriptional regulator [Vallitaleaceae bacterium]|jgi:PadR family transcriptional regulator PadR|nr:PadR family transcriptional regulator [Vallitaleaceae bacterium]